MATKSKKTELTKRQYYTLQQAADELNRHFKVENPDNPIIDVDYLLHLGAIGEIQIYVYSGLEMDVSDLSLGSRRDSEDVNHTVSYGNQLLSTSPWLSNFAQVNKFELSDLFHFGFSRIYGTREVLVRNYAINYQPIDEDVATTHLMAELGKSAEAYKKLLEDHGLTAESELTVEFNNALAESKRNNPLPPSFRPRIYDGQAYISLSEVLSVCASECGEKDGFWLFRYKQDINTPNVATGQDLTRDNLFIFSQHLEALKRGDTEHAKSENLTSEQEKALSLHGLTDHNLRAAPSRVDARTLASYLWTLECHKKTSKIKMAELIMNELNRRQSYVPSTVETIGDWIADLAPAETRTGGRPKKQ